jgi:hypothetical protein
MKRTAFALVVACVGAAWSGAALAQSIGTRSTSFAYDSSTGLLVQEVVEPNASSLQAGGGGAGAPNSIGIVGTITSVSAGEPGGAGDGGSGGAGSAGWRTSGTEISGGGGSAGDTSYGGGGSAGKVNFSGGRCPRHHRHHIHAEQLMVSASVECGRAHFVLGCRTQPMDLMI